MDRSANPTATTTATGERSSRFVEPPMHEYTPANSLYDDDGDDEPGRLALRSRVRTFMRILNAALHMVACVLLLAIVAKFLARYRGMWYRYMRWVLWAHSLARSRLVSPFPADYPNQPRGRHPRRAAEPRHRP